MDEFVFVPCVLRIRFHTNTTYMFSNSNMDNMNIVCGGGGGVQDATGISKHRMVGHSGGPAGHGPSIAAHLSHAAQLAMAHRLRPT